jgi:hypothetical protein
MAFHHFWAEAVVFAVLSALWFATLGAVKAGEDRARLVGHDGVVRPPPDWLPSAQSQKWAGVNGVTLTGSTDAYRRQ